MVPPLPKEASVIRHTSVRGLKRQSDERKRDRESGQYVVNGDYKVRRHLLPVVVLILCVYFLYRLDPLNISFYIVRCSQKSLSSPTSCLIFSGFRLTCVHT